MCLFVHSSTSCNGVSTPLAAVGVEQVLEFEVRSERYVTKHSLPRVGMTLAPSTSPSPFLQPPPSPCSMWTPYLPLPRYHVDPRQVEPTGSGGGYRSPSEREVSPAPHWPGWWDIHGRQPHVAFCGPVSSVRVSGGTDRPEPASQPAGSVRKCWTAGGIASLRRPEEEEAYQLRHRW